MDGLIPMTPPNIYELAEDRNPDPELMAKIALGMALDNGHDMFNADAKNHAETEWEGYVHNVVDFYAEDLNIIHGETIDQTRKTELYNDVIDSVPKVAKEFDLSIER